MSDNPHPSTTAQPAGLVKDAAVLRGYVSLAGEFASGTTTPRAYLDECLVRIATLEPRIGAFVAVCDYADAAARADAATARWQDGQPRSAVDGMPVAVKDIIETGDMPTGQGSPMWYGTRTGRDAASVHALREAGAIILGKTTTNEFAGAHPFHDTRNPHDTQRSPGGSSSGSAAAVAAGMVPVALGTQVFCSIVQPASFCGAIGCKPTYGAINRGGSYDQLSQSAHGAIAATLADLWAALRAIADRVGGDPGFAGLSGEVHFAHPARPIRLAVLETDGWAHTTHGARNAFAEATDTLADAGVELVGRREDAQVDRVEHVLKDAASVSLAICAWENRWPLSTYTDQSATELSPDSRQRLEQAQSMSSTQYADLLARRTQARAAFADTASRYDGFITLSATGAAPPIEPCSTGDPAMSVHASYLGCPTITLPLQHEHGLPLGVQLLTAPDHDATLFDLAMWIAHEPFSQPTLVGSRYEPD